MNYEKSKLVEDNSVYKIGGSVYGGEWRPSKPEDERLIGESGDVKQSFAKKGELIETHIGLDGTADYETHHTDHGFPKYHDNPHIHEIYWDERGPHLGNKELFGKNFALGMGHVYTKTLVGTNSYEENRFKSISDFKDCMNRGGEVQFEWHGVEYCCFGVIRPSKDAKPKMVIAQAGSIEINTRTEQWCDTPDQILEYMVGSDRLRDVITQVTVFERTL